jgi:hypothetical protein
MAGLGVVVVLVRANLIDGDAWDSPGGAVPAPLSVDRNLGSKSSQGMWRLPAE